MSQNEQTRKQISDIIGSDDVVLFMKGNRNFPQCGFSARVVQILDGIVPEYTTVNVLADPAIRQGIKDYSNWPTIPQLYVRGEFIGGCDIVTELHQSGELVGTLGVELEEVAPPEITVTDAAAKALREALAEADPDDVIHISISARFEHGLDMGPAVDTAVTLEANGIGICIDRVSAKRANGMVIDFVERAEGAGFKIDNPNAPPQVKMISPSELKGMLDSGEIKELFDVRTPREVEIARIDGSRLLDDATVAYIEDLDQETPIAFYCHHDARSASAATHFRDKGFRNVYVLAGGIDSWAQEVDTSLSRY
jgi:monothiol glutaredoxin